VDRRPWWEQLFDQDSRVGPILVLVLLVLAIGLVLLIGPLLDRMIEGKSGASFIAPLLALGLCWRGRAARA